MIICESDKCTGCYACQNACQHNAIKLVPSKHSYIHPFIDTDACVKCNLCKNVCPVNSPVQKSTPLHSHIAQATEKDIVASSSSGGIISVFAQCIIREGGIVYGCTGKEGVRHIRIDNVQDTALLRGSKYVQSNINFIYREIKKDLINKKPVLFIGTPCQNAALRNYLRYDYSNLICIDFICHGVPSQEMLARHIEEQTGLKPEQTGEVIFRSRNKKGHGTFGVTVYSKDRTLCYSKHYPKDRYITAYIHGLTYRESCYQCQYTTPERVSDITLGDYWDNENNYSKDGLSMLIVNTEKGNNLFKSASTEISIIDKGDLEAFAERNQQLKEPMRRHPKRDLFLLNYNTDTFNNAAQKALSDSYRAMQRQKIKKYLFFIPGIEYIYRIIAKR